MILNQPERLFPLNCGTFTIFAFGYCKKTCLFMVIAISSEYTFIIYYLVQLFQFLIGIYILKALYLLYYTDKQTLWREPTHLHWRRHLVDQSSATQLKRSQYTASERDAQLSLIALNRWLCWFLCAVPLLFSEHLVSGKLR